MSLDNRLKFSGESDAKGRNGYFKLGAVDAWTSRADPDQVVRYLDFYSRRGSDSPPIRFAFNKRSDLEVFKRALDILLEEGA
jgi:hypothetical protein